MLFVTGKSIFGYISLISALWIITNTHATAFLALESRENISNNSPISGVAVSTTDRSSFISNIRPQRAVKSLIKRSCSAPPQPENGEWKLNDLFCEEGVADCKVPGGTDLGLGYQLIYSCRSGYRIEESNIVYCGPKGEWSHIPVCREIQCEPLNSVSRIGHCFRSDENVDCSLPVPPSTRAEVSCRPGYRKDTTISTPWRNILSCNEDGHWEPRPIRCVPVCGQAATHQRPFSINGWNASIGDFPWHATLYMKRNLREETKKEFACGATIIQANLVMTAAHCVYDETIQAKQDPRKLFIMTGNTFRDYDHSSHNPDIVKKATVKRVHVPFNFYGLPGNYASDIAILELQEPFIFSEILLPACLDSYGYNAPILEPGSNGRVAGFGITATGETSPILQTITLPYVAYSECKTSAKAAANEVFITKDKFCAGYTNGSAVCEGDSGGGLVFPKNNQWYVMGIVSVGLGVDINNGARTCERYAYTLYTTVSEHIEWILDVIYKVELSELRDSSNPNLSRSTTTTLAPQLPGSHSVTPTPLKPNNQSSCLAPPQPAHGRLEFHATQCARLGRGKVDCNVPQGAKLASGSRIVYKCHTGYTAVRKETAAWQAPRWNIDCTDAGTWSDELECVEPKCSAFDPLTTQALCFDPSNKPIGNCNTPMPAGTQAAITCREFSQKQIVTCTMNHLWEPKPIECTPTDCGSSSALDDLSMISTGEAKSIKIPWYASVFIQPSVNGKNRFICGATIIRKQLLFIAAHCVYVESTQNTVYPTHLFVTAGDVHPVYQSDMENPMSVQKRQVQKIIINPDYQGKEGYDGDIALLILETPFHFDEHIQPACLDAETQILGIGVHGMLIGFGRAANGNLSEFLQAKSVPYIPDEECFPVRRKDNVFFSRHHFCAGYLNGSTACPDEDEYGGLVVKKNGRWYVTGIPSVALRYNFGSGKGTCDKYSNVVFTEVFKHISWIRSKSAQFNTEQ